MKRRKFLEQVCIVPLATKLGLDRFVSRSMVPEEELPRSYQYSSSSGPLDDWDGDDDEDWETSTEYTEISTSEMWKRQGW